MASRVKVSKKHQIAVPSEVRRLLGIKSGDTLIAEVRDRSIVLTPLPQDHCSALLGLHKEIWQGLDAMEYVRKEREAWGS